jgi:hypothetical protein
MIVQRFGRLQREETFSESHLQKHFWSEATKKPKFLQETLQELTNG